MEVNALKGRNSFLLLGIAFAAIAFTISPLVAFAIDTAMVSLQGAGGGLRLQEILGAFGSTATRSALKFSLTQAGLSTILAMVVGFPGAFFVARYKFAGRRFFLSLAAVPFCLPPILVILAFILYYGKSGWLSAAFRSAGFSNFGESGFLYSLWGLVFVHAFYNFPIVVQNVGAIWTKMPNSREEAARTLGAGRLKAFMTGTLPYLIPSLLQSASLIFLFCFFSFTIVLVFGGLSGTTLEVGIYRAIRFTNDKPLALALALIQTAIALLIISSFGYFDKKNAAIARGFGNSPPRRQPKPTTAAAIALYTILIIIFFLGPLFALVAEAFTLRSSLAGPARFGLGNFSRLLAGAKAPLILATANSLAIGGAAALLATIAGMAVAAASHYAKQNRGQRKPGNGIPLSAGMAHSPSSRSVACCHFSWLEFSHPIGRRDPDRSGANGHSLAFCRQIAFCGFLRPRQEQKRSRANSWLELFSRAAKCGRCHHFSIDRQRRCLRILDNHGRCQYSSCTRRRTLRNPSPSPLPPHFVVSLQRSVRRRHSAGAFHEHRIFPQREIK